MHADQPMRAHREGQGAASQVQLEGLLPAVTVCSQMRWPRKSNADLHSRGALKTGEILFSTYGSMLDQGSALACWQEGSPFKQLQQKGKLQLSSMGASTW